jgi:PAS domain S-box-containing protein
MDDFQMENFDQAVLEGKATWWRMELPSGDVYFGDAKTKMLGYKEEDFQHYQDFTNLLHPEDHDKAMQAMKDHLEGKKNFYETVYRIKTKSGDYITFYDLGQIIEKKEGNTVVMGFVFKVEEDVDIKEQMKEFKRLILEGNPSMLELVKKAK